MHDHVVFFGKDDPRLVPERWRNALDGVEETVTTGGDMSAVLNVVGGPIALGRCIVPLVEQCVEGLEDERFVLLFNRLMHFYPPSRTGCATHVRVIGPFCRRRRGRKLP